MFGGKDGGNAASIITLALGVSAFVNNVHGKSRIVVTDFSFRLCYIVTSACLFLFSSLIGLRGTFGK